MKKSRLLTYLFFSLIASSAFGIEVAGFTFNPPSEWIASKPTSNMRKAQFKAPSKSSSSAEVAFFLWFHWSRRYSGKCRPMDETIRRSSGKVVNTEKFDEVSLTFAQAHGTFLSGSPFGPKTPNRDMP